MADRVFDKSFQDNLLAALITDNDFISQGRSLLPVDTFLSPIVKVIVEHIYQFYDSYGTAPGDNFASYFEELVHAGAFNADDAVLCRKYLSDISQLTPNSKYLLETISLWRKRQAIKAALFEAAPLIERGTMEDIMQTQALMYAAFDKGIQEFDLGLDLGQIKGIPDNMFQPDFRFMIDALDQAIGGLKRGELMAFHGLPGVGKTWSLVHCLRALALQGEAGVIYSGEQTKWEIVGRAAQNFGALTSTKLQETRGWNPYTKTFHSIQNPRCLDDSGVVANAISQAFGFGSRIFVREFVPDEFTTDDINTHLDNLERSLGVQPLVILVDYDELMAPRRRQEQTRLNILDIFNGLKGIAKKRNIIVILATQSNAQGMSATLIGMGNLGEAFAKAKPTDVLISLNQTQQEYIDGTMRLYVYKNRNGPRYQVIKIWQNFTTGQFCLHSERIFANQGSDGVPEDLGPPDSQFTT